MKIVNLRTLQKSSKPLYKFDFDYNLHLLVFSSESGGLDEDWLKAHPKVGQAARDLDGMISELDTKLDRQLKKQEHDYLKGYSIYVKTKEKELKTLIQKLNAKNSNNTLKDKTIYKLN